MRRLACMLAALGAGLVLSAGDASAQSGCRPAGSEARPVASPRINTIMGTNGPFQFRMASFGRRCEGDADGHIRPERPNAKGLMDARGRRVLVPAAYVQVLPISETIAIVWRAHGQDGVMYEFGRGETGPAPVRGFGRLMGSDRELSTPVAGRPTLNVYLGGGQVRQINDIADYRQYENYVIADFTIDGAEVSAVFDASMREPRSPVVGRIDPFRMITPAALGDARLVYGAPFDLASRAMEMDHPDLPYGRVYMPLAADGRAAALPDGALGVIPMKVVHNPPPGSADQVRRDLALGWAVVFPSRDGVEIAPVTGTLAEALQRAPTAPRLSGWRQDGNLYFGRDMQGQWRNFHVGFTNLEEALASGPAFASVEEARFGFFAELRERGRLERLARAEREREYAEHLRQEGVRQWARLQAGGRLCGPDTRPGILPPEGLERYFRECDVDPNFIRNLGPGVSAEARATATRRAEVVAEEYARERAEAERERFFGGPESAGDPWARGLAAAEAAAQASHNAFVQRAQQTYMTNLNAWNSGAQNWYYSRP